MKLTRRSVVVGGGVAIATLLGGGVAAAGRAVGRAAAAVGAPLWQQAYSKGIV